MQNLNSKFTSAQVAKLQGAGFNSLYQIITYLPFRIQDILPLDIYSPQVGNLYSCIGVLKNIQLPTKPKKFLLLEWVNLPIKTYIFSVSKYTLAALKLGQEYQLTLTYKDGFWAIKKYLANWTEHNYQPNQVILEPIYERVKDISPTLWLSIHKRLSPKDYLLDLGGLLPKNNILTDILDLGQIHHPKNKESFEQARQQWIAFKTYLYACLIKYSNLKSQVVVAKSTLVDFNFLKEITSDLPFALTPSQKSVIWHLLNEMQSKNI